MSTPRAAGELSPLLRPEWRYVEKTNLDHFRAADWALMNAQRAPYLGQERARQALRLLEASRADASYGYMINNYEHCLQTATFMLEDGRDEEEIVCGLFHDLGFIVCNETHGQFAAMLLGPYISERNRWMLERHMIFQARHIHGIEGLDRDARERWRGHPHFEWSAEFVAKYDICTIDPARAPAPLETFRPLVERVFARPPKAIPPA